MRQPGRVRLDRALSKLGIASRAAARELIAAGKVSVHGRAITDPSHLVTPETARIAVVGEPAVRARWRTILLHKPRGTVTTRRDPEGRRTVFDCLGPEAHSLVAAGRLDLATSGVLILTTDTRFADWLTDPSTAVVRRYAVTVRGRLADDEARRMQAGVDGLSAQSVAVRKRSHRETHLLVELTEGKNREVRRLCEAVGHEVSALKRVAFGALELGELPPGEWRDVTRAELRRAFPGAPLARDIDSVVNPRLESSS
jgi:23S rRNA pseudouridine2605 synthase